MNTDRQYFSNLQKNQKFDSRFNFLTTIAKDIDEKKVIKLENTINRSDATTKINDILFNIEKSIQIEAGLFEYTVMYSKMEDICDELFEATYNDKLNDILINLNKKYNETLIDSIINDKLNSYEVAFLNPNELNPKKWEFLVQKQEMKKFREENMSATDVYYCKKCGAKKSRVYQMQTRSADEPMTTFVTCLVCFNTFKF
jgi:DNA-directed RNA polymerase subunit M/transcription elongation factor TFIIS